MRRSECRYRNRRLPAPKELAPALFDAGSRAIEDVLARDPRTEHFCYGDRLAIADICLVAHLTSAKLLSDPPAMASGRTSDGATLREYKIRSSALP